MEKKVTTYGDLKCRKAELRNEMELGDMSNLDEYQLVLQQIKNVESCLLWSIICSEPELPVEQVKPKARRKIKIAVIAISVAVVLAIVVLSSCHTVNGVGRDLSAWSSPYIEHQEK